MRFGKPSNNGYISNVQEGLSLIWTIPENFCNEIDKEELAGFHALRSKMNRYKFAFFDGEDTVINDGYLRI